MPVREDFADALEAMIEDFAVDPGISDEEIVHALMAKAKAILLNMERLEGRNDGLSSDTVSGDCGVRDLDTSGRPAGDPGAVTP
jgi:hypothetical protein